MNSKIPASSNHLNYPFLRPLGAFEELPWLLDQHRPFHFVMAAEVDGATTVNDWRRALDLVQQRHPLLSVGIEKNGENRPCFRQDLAAQIPLRVVPGTNVTERWEFQTEPIEPCEATTFWEIARSATTRLGTAQTLEAIRAARHGMFQVMKPGLDVSTAADIMAQGFANDIVLTDLGNLGYPTDFGKLQLKAVWGPAVAPRFADAHAIGVTTTNGSLRLIQTTFAPVESMLETAEEILVSVCATRKHVMVAQLPR